jgi:CopG family nickel-responsive transcriptional regulator
MEQIGTPKMSRWVCNASRTVEDRGALDQVQALHFGVHLEICKKGHGVKGKERGEKDMRGTIRFGISIDDKLLDSFDRLIELKGYMNRSEAIRDLIRAALVELKWEGGEEETVGTVTLVYNHHVRDLSEKLTEQQHTHHDQIISALHVHLDAHNCLEVLVVRGKAREVKKIADELIGVKGVKHGKLVMTTAGEELH